MMLLSLNFQDRWDGAPLEFILGTQRCIGMTDNPCDQGVDPPRPSNYKCWGWILLRLAHPQLLLHPLPSPRFLCRLLLRLHMVAQEIAKFEAKQLAEEVRAQKVDLQAKDAELDNLRKKVKMKLQAKDAELQSREVKLEDLKMKTSDMLLRHQEESVELQSWLESTTEQLRGRRRSWRRWRIGSTGRFP